METSAKRFSGSDLDVNKIAAAFGVPFTASVHRLNSGIINTSFVVRSKKMTYVVRVYVQTKKKAVIQRELAVMESLRARGISIPRFFSKPDGSYVHTFKDKKGKRWFAVMMEFVKGKELTARNFAVLPQVATIHAQMHNFLAEEREIIQKKKALAAIARSVFGEVRKALKDSRISENERTAIRMSYTKLYKDWNLAKDSLIKLPFGMAHLDYDSSNILVRDGNVEGVIDFDDIDYIPFVIDLGFSLWWWSFFNFSNYENVINEYLNSYKKVRTLLPLELGLLPLVIRMRNLMISSLIFITRSEKIDVLLISRALKLDRQLSKFGHEEK